MVQLPAVYEMTQRRREQCIC